MNKLIVVISAIIIALTPSLSQTFSNNSPVTFNAGDDACISVNVTGIPTALNHDLGLLSITFDITHPDVSDFDITLTSPSGNTYTFIQNYNMSGSNYTSTIIDDIGPDISDASSPYNGNFRPSEFDDNLCAINNDIETGDGTWTLCIDNWSLGAGGTINSFALTFGNNAGSIHGANVATDQIEANTPFICDFEGYIGYTNSCYSIQNIAGNLDDEFCGALNNNSWVSFEAANANVTLDVEVSECADNDGVQFAVFSTPDYINFTRLYCDNTVEPGANSINISGLTPGEMYYMMIDGWAGDRCKYEVTASSSSGLAIVDAQASDTIICYGETVSLNGLGASTYNWTSSNVVFSNPTLQNQSDNPTTDTWYYLEGTTSQGCVAIDSIFVEVVSPPVVNAGLDDTLTCTITSLTLNSSGSSSGINFDYNWSTNNGNIVSGNTSSNPLIDTPGSYILSITDNITTCNLTDTVIITEDIVIPSVNAGVDQVINCLNATVQLDGTGSSNGNNYSYNWSTNNGNIISGGNSTIATVDADGQYNLTVTDNTNGCTNSAVVNVTSDLNNPIANAGNDVVLTCTNTTLSLDGSASSTGPNINYVWSTNNGNILSGLNTVSPTIDQEGTYVITVLNNDNGCSQTDTVLVSSNTTLPIANAGINDTLTCSQTSITLDANNSSSGANYNYSWTTNNGNIVNGQSTITPQVDQAGEYVVLVLDNTNGCSQQDTVSIIENTTLPTVGTTNPDTITCSVLTVLLDGSGSSFGSSFNYQWTTSNGNIVSGGNSLNPEVSAPGDYILEVIDTDNGCSNSATLMVVENVQLPLADAGIDQTLSCSSTTVDLDGSGSSQGGNYSYSWTSTGGNFTSNTNALQVSVNGAGTYTLAVTDNNNGCESTDEVMVNSDNNLPNADAGLNDTLTCTNTSITLDGNNSSSGASYTYLWTTSNGNILSGENTLNPVINTAGEYTLTITDNNNGCSNSSQVSVLEDLTLPITNAGTDDTLNCFNTTLNLDGSLSSNGNNFNYNWTTINGNIDSGSNSITPTISSAGEYLLTITNTENGCESEDTVSVILNNQVPTVNAGLDDTLNCTVLSLTLNGSGSSVGASFSYNWTTLNGSIQLGENSLTPTINGEGNYVLSVIDSNNGCENTDTVTIVLDNAVPIVDAGLNDTLTCSNTTVILNGTFSGANNASIQWTTINGAISSGENDLTMTTGVSGIYILTITNEDNQCVSSDTATVVSSAGLPIADAGSDTALNCSNSTITLNGSNSSSGVDLIYNWTTSNGNITSGVNTFYPVVDQAGDYILTVTNTSNGCEATDMVTVLDDTTPPLVNAGNNDTINCNNITLVLDGSNSSNGPNLSYQWNTNDGVINSGNTTLNPTVSGEGTYILTISNLNNNCSASDSVIIIENNVFPVADAGNSDTLNCTTLEVTLGGANTSNGNDFSYLWTTSNGSISSSNSSNSITANSTGSYVLTVSHSGSGCTSTDTVNVFENTILPLSNAGENDTLTCGTTSISLDGTSSSSGSNYSYSWNSIGGNIVDGTNTINPTVNQPGEYVLTVTDNINGCIHSDTVTVFSSSEAPSAFAGENDTLTCTNTALTLNGTGSTGNNFSYSWTTTNGNIISGNNSLSPVINAIGTYLLTVTNNNNNCTTSSSVSIFEDIENPLITIGNQDSITCNQDSVILNLTASNFDIAQWSSSTGGSISNVSILNPTVYHAGNYEVIITNSSNGCSSQATVTIEENLNTPMANAGFDQNITCGMSNANIDGSMSSSGNYISYSWISSNPLFQGENNSSFLTNLDGTFVLTVTDNQSGCLSMDTVVVINNSESPIVIIENPDTITCNQSNITLDGSSSSSGDNYNYLWWSTGGTTITNATSNIGFTSEPDTFWLVVTNVLSNCADSSFTIVNSNLTLPQVDAGLNQTLNCNDNNVTLGDMTTFEFNTNYNWYQFNTLISTGNTINVNTPGEYFLEAVATNGCSNWDTVVVAIDTVSPNVILNAPTDITCNHLADTISVIGGNYGDFTYDWTTSITYNLLNDSTLEVSSGGNILLTVSNDINGCSASFPLTIGMDTISPDMNLFGIDELTCRNPISTISASTNNTNVSYEWSTNNGIIIIDADSLIQVNQGGDYSLVLMDTINGCSTSQTFTISEDFNYIPLNLGMIDDMCSDAPIISLDSLASPSGGTWNGMGIVQNFFDPSTVLSGEQTLYYTILNDSNGCVSVDSMNFLVNPLPNVEILGNTNLCVGEELILEGIGATGYFWNTGETGNTITITNDSSQLIVLQGFDGYCYNADSLWITAVNPSVTLIEDITSVEFPYSSNLEVDTSQVDQVHWYIDDTWVSSSTSLSYFFNQVINHDIMVVGINDNSGCTDTLSFTLNVESPGLVFMPNAFSPDNHGSNDVYYVVSEDFAEVTIRVFDRWGTLVYQWHDASQGWDGRSMDGQELPVGVYVISVDGLFTNGEKFQTIKSVTLIR